MIRCVIPQMTSPSTWYAGTRRSASRTLTLASRSDGPSLETLAHRWRATSALGSILGRRGRANTKGRTRTGGSTGVSLALICGAKGYPLHVVTSDAFSLEKRDHMQALGAKLTLIDSVDGGINETLTRDMIEAARRTCERKGGFWTDQLNNADQLVAYRSMGDEIWRQTEGKVDAYVQSVGTAASLRGVAESLREKNPDIHIVAMEPSESAVLSGGETGVHKIEGIGAGFVVPLWEPGLVDEIATVSSDDAKHMTRRLARAEALFAGTSTGGNLVAAFKVAARLGPKATVVTVMCDSGIKYLSTDLYKDGGKQAQAAPALSS